MPNFDGVKGQKIIYLYRKYSDRGTKTGLNVAYVSDNSKSMSSNADTLATKDGTFSPGQTPEITISTTAYMKKGDEMLDTLKSALLNNDLLEIWEANLELPGTATGTYKGTYFQGYISSFNVNSTAEEWVEVDMDFTINGKGADGDVTVPSSIIEQADYVFADATIVL